MEVVVSTSLSVRARRVETLLTSSAAFLVQFDRSEVRAAGKVKSSIRLSFTIYHHNPAAQ